jgi:hypothetical protein
LSPAARNGRADGRTDGCKCCRHLMRSSVHELEEGRPGVFFLFAIFGCSQTGDHVQKDFSQIWL